MEPGSIKKRDEELNTETSMDRSYSSAMQSVEENEIRILTWQFELMLRTMDGTSSSK